MSRFAIVLALCVLSIDLEATEHDWLIEPGVRIGPINGDTSEADLRAIFGESAVRDGHIHLGEGETVPGTVLFADESGSRLEVVWTEQSRTMPKYVRITCKSEECAKSKWRTLEGISVGSRLREIEKLNGYPFRLTGFAWDYAGGITSYGPYGRLGRGNCSDDASRTAGYQMTIRLAPNLESREMPEYRQVLGDRVFSSGHPAMQAMNPRVYQIEVWLSCSTPDPRQSIIDTDDGSQR
ncbi:MAG: hypothetical protein AAF265_14835 [Pseudomonadota bacterium]